MAGLQPWESDPLFSAAEVVQDSVDRMESIFRLLQHELSLEHDDPETRPLVSIDNHRRDLVTTLETAKWQLEDFERAVSISTPTDKFPRREVAISRHKQFVRAIREQIHHVERNLKDVSMGVLMRNTEWFNLNEQDRDGLTLFLSGGNSEQIDSNGAENGDIMRRFLDPSAESSLKDSSTEIIEHESREIANLNVNGIMPVDNNFDSIEDVDLGKVSSQYSIRIEAPDSSQGTSYNRHYEDGTLDLEANHDGHKSFSPKARFRGYYILMNLFGFFNNLWTPYWNRISRSHTKRLKDGGEERHSPSYCDVSHDAQGRHSNFHQLGHAFSTWAMPLISWLRACRASYRRSLYHVEVNPQSLKLIFTILFTVLVLGILMIQIL